MNRLALTLSAAASVFLPGASSGADRSKPPAAGPVRPLTLPTLHRQTLSNGIPVVIATMNEVPVVDIAVVVRAGATADPKDKPGTALLTADMLDEGAGGKGALDLEDALDFLGAEITAGATWDQATVRLHVPVARLNDALPLLSDIALRPDFPEADFERVRTELLNDFLQSRDEARDVASAALARAVFGASHRYGTPVRGTAAAVQGLTPAALRAFHKTRYTADQAAIIVAGAVTADTLVPLLEKAFGTWKKGAESGAVTSIQPPERLKLLTLVLVDKPGAAQSVVRFGMPGPDRRTPAFADLQVMNTLLGGSFTSRLNDNLREQHGYAYGASSSFDYRRTGGLFIAGADVQTDKTAAAVGEFVKELERIRTPATAEEAERARNYAALGYGSEVETTRQIASKLVAQWIFGLPEDSLGSFVPAALAVGAPQIQKAAATWVDPARTALVVVGDRKTVEASLQALKLGAVHVLSVDDVLGPAPKI